MTVYITAISPQGTQHHEHITRVWWLNSQDNVSAPMTVEQAVDYIRSGHQLWVAGEHGAAQVGVVEGQRPFVRTRADGDWTDNLLNLPRF